MNESELTNFLFKLSVQALHRLGDESSDPQEIKEAIERNSKLRPILYCVQLIQVRQLNDDGLSLVFKLSPDYLIENEFLVMQGLLDVLNWTFTLPSYEYDKQEGVVEWMMKGIVDVNSINDRIYSVNLEQFQKSIIATEAD